MTKQTIAVDVDDVLSTFAEQMIDFSNQRWGTSLRIEDIDENWSRMWQIDHKTTKERSHILHDSLFQTLDSTQYAYSVLQRLKKHYRLVITTSRSNRVKQRTQEWIQDNFADIFDEIHHATIYDGPITDLTFKQTKRALCEEIGADYLIDDQPKHCIAVAEAGIDALLFGSYPWNQVNDLPDRVTRVNDWQQVAGYFNV